MTWVISLLVVAIFVSLVIISIVLGVIVYHKRKRAKSTTDSNLTAHKGPLVDEVSNLLANCALVSNTIM